MRHDRDVAAGGECAALVEVAVQADNLMTCLYKHRHHNGSDVTKMSGNQNAHRKYSSPLRLFPRHRYWMARVDMVPPLHRLGPSPRCVDKRYPAFLSTAVLTAAAAPLIRQGIRPCSTRSSSTSLSFNVSIGRQKPSCLKARS